MQPIDVGEGQGREPPGPQGDLPLEEHGLAERPNLVLFTRDLADPGAARANLRPVLVDRL